MDVRESVAKADNSVFGADRSPTGADNIVVDARASGKDGTAGEKVVNAEGKIGYDGVEIGCDDCTGVKDSYVVTDASGITHRAGEKTNPFSPKTYPKQLH